MKMHDEILKNNKTGNNQIENLDQFIFELDSSLNRKAQKVIFVH